MCPNRGCEVKRPLISGFTWCNKFCHPQAICLRNHSVGLSYLEQARSSDVMDELAPAGDHHLPTLHNGGDGTPARRSSARYVLHMYKNKRVWHEIHETAFLIAESYRSRTSCSGKDWKEILVVPTSNTNECNAGDPTDCVLYRTCFVANFNPNMVMADTRPMLWVRAPPPTTMPRTSTDWRLGRWRIPLAKSSRRPMAKRPR
jgi:hypothetical protein